MALLRNMLLAALGLVFQQAIAATGGKDYHCVTCNWWLQASGQLVQSDLPRTPAAHAGHSKPQSLLSLTIVQNDALDHTLLYIIESTQLNQTEGLVTKELRPNKKVELFSVSATQIEMAVNTLSLDKPRSVPIGYKVSHLGEYEICVTDYPEHWNMPIVLEDRDTHTFVDLDFELRYRFEADRYYDQSRFVLHFLSLKSYLTTPQDFGGLKVEFQGRELYVNSNAPQQICVRVTDVNGILSKDLCLQGCDLAISLADLPKGIYFVRVSQGSQTVIKRIEV